jgi:hypothetical protein
VFSTSLIGASALTAYNPAGSDHGIAARHGKHASEDHHT